LREINLGASVVNFYRVWLFCVLIIVLNISFGNNTIEGIQDYQKNLPLSPEHKQKLADDISRYRNADNIWDALREEFTLSHEEDNPAVQEKIDWFMNNQDFLLRSATRAAPYLYYISQQVKKRHLPAELVLLPIVESGYNPFSLSNVGAAGIWQLMPGTASDLGVRQDWWFDGRRDVIASTRAALSYLAYLESFFDGNWLYAIAAYNTGLGNVLSAIKRNIRDARDTDFWSLPVAQQTKDYVPSLLALAIIISNPDRYPVYFPPVRNAPYLAQVEVSSQINLVQAATFAGINYKKLLQLNPGFNRPAAFNSSNGSYKLVLPIENVEQFTENVSMQPSVPHQVNWIHYKVKSGDTLATISKKFDTTIGSIRKLNHINKETISAGTNLLIPIKEMTALAIKENKENKINKKTNEHFEKNFEKTIAQSNSSQPIESYSFPKKYVLIPGDTIYMVRNKDTLDTIAKRFHLSVYALKATHQFKGRGLIPGKQVIIPTHLVQINKQKNINNNSNTKDIFYIVRRGDTIEKIARKFNTKPAAIRLANLMRKSKLEIGEGLIIPASIRG
jgi:membrane-bound lytic murein transglycosylase D